MAPAVVHATVLGGEQISTLRVQLHCKALVFCGLVFRRGGGNLSTISLGITTPPRRGLLKFPVCLGGMVKAPDICR